MMFSRHFSRDRYNGNSLRGDWVPRATPRTNRSLVSSSWSSFIYRTIRDNHIIRTASRRCQALAQRVHDTSVSHRQSLSSRSIQLLSSLDIYCISGWALSTLWHSTKVKESSCWFWGHTLQQVEIAAQETMVQGNVGARAGREGQSVGGVTGRRDSFPVGFYGGRASWRRKVDLYWILRMENNLAGGYGEWVGQWGIDILGGRSQQERCMGLNCGKQATW